MGILTRVLGRLGAYFDPLTAPALAGSLQVWAEVARDPAWRGRSDAQKALGEQVLRWYELLVLGQDPKTLGSPCALLKDWRATLRAAGAFWPQLLVASLSVVALVAFGALVASGNGTTLGKTILVVAGIFGVTGASLQAKIKNTSQALVARLRQDVYTDLVAEEITVEPTVLAEGGAPASSRATRRTVRRRRLTPSLR